MAKLNPADALIRPQGDPPEGYREVYVALNSLRVLWLNPTSNNDTTDSWTPSLAGARVFGNFGHPLNKARLASVSGYSSVSMGELNRVSCVTVAVQVHKKVLEPWYVKGQHTLPTTLTLGNVLPEAQYSKAYIDIKALAWEAHDMALESVLRAGLLSADPFLQRWAEETKEEAFTPSFQAVPNAPLGWEVL